MAISMKANSKTEREMASDATSIVMVITTSVCGRMTANTAMASSSTLMEKSKKESGRMVS